MRLFERTHCSYVLICKHGAELTVSLPRVK